MTAYQNNTIFLSNIVESVMNSDQRYADDPRLMRLHVRLKNSHHDEFTYPAKIEGDDSNVKIYPIDGQDMIYALNIIQKFNACLESRVLIEISKEIYEATLKIANSLDAQNRAFWQLREPDPAA